MKVGTIVYLKSGSPALTVTRLGFNDDGDSTATVQWIDDDGETASNTFPTVCLTETAPVAALTYANLVANKKKDGDDILAAMTGYQADAWHMATGVAGEAGELLDAIKRWAVYQKPLDRENVIEELGDLEFFMEGLRQRLGITRDETITANIDKLSKRYKEKYTDAEAAGRADKAPATGIVLDSSTQRLIDDDLGIKGRTEAHLPDNPHGIPSEV